MSSALVLDATLALTLVAVGVRVLLARDLFQAIVLFIIFGMLLGIAWCRLEAVDVALAEVAIGAGLTGSLLLNTLAATRRSQASGDGGISQTTAETPRRASPIWRHRVEGFVAVGFALCVAGGLAAVVAPSAMSGGVSLIPVADSMQQSGVSNPVTAVLLNFRAYDTLMEVAVLLAAVMVVRQIAVPATALGARPLEPVLASFTRMMVRCLAVVAVYVLWQGTTAAGGAFQAAAILAAAGVMLIVVGGAAPRTERLGWRMVLASGLVLFLLAAVGGMVAGGRFLQLSPPWAGAVILLIETGLMASIAVMLIVLFHGTSASRDSTPLSGASEALPRKETSP